MSVLFARSDSNYYALQGTDVYDMARNALTYPGGTPVIAHPPCRAWGRLSHMASPRLGERALAPWAVYQVRENGGVLEHPANSKLWRDLTLPTGKDVDLYGGYTLAVDQFWWGHKARKKTWLYVVGVPRKELPATPLRFGRATHTIGACAKYKSAYKRPEVTHAEREHTPVAMAQWLLEVARLTSVNSLTLNSSL